MGMFASTRKSMRAATACCAAIVLSGCAVITSPGFDFSQTSQRNSVSLTPGVADGTEAATPAQTAIRPINAELLRHIAQTHRPDLPTGLLNLYAEPAPYTIGASDVIGIVVHDHPELMATAGASAAATDPAGITASPGFIVDADGFIIFPYIGKVAVAGLTPTQATQRIAQKLAHYIHKPQVTVRVQAFRSKRVYVEGEVRNPGMQIFTDVPMTLPEALNRAGGLTEHSDRSEILLTRDGHTTRIDLNTLQQLNGNPNRILLRSGDNLRVRNRNDKKIYVLGESLKAAALSMEHGKLSLAQALGESGGVNPTTADPGQIYVIRNRPDSLQPEVFHLDAKNPVALALADNFPLQARDVVYIDPVPLVRWNRIISLVLPTASVLNTSSEISNR